MRKCTKLIILPLLFLVIISASACSVNGKDDAINFWIDAREQAIKSGDIEAYMQTVNADNYYLYNEEFNLISSLDAGELSSISVTASPVRNEEDAAVYKITQQYEYRGQDYRCSYNAHFIKDSGRLVYNGMESEMLSSGSAQVHYPDGYRDSAKGYASAVKYYLEKLNEVYAYSPDPEICIRIFDDHDVFLQSVKFDLPKWVGGWHEYGESVKIFVPGQHTAVYPEMIYHECSHRFLSEITNDNASYWMQEGFATLMETAIPTGLANIEFLYNNDIEGLKAAESLWKFGDFVEVNLEELSDPVQVTGYYSLSALCVEHIMDIMGIEDFLAVMSRMKENPQIHKTASEKIGVTNDLTIACISKRLGMAENDFYSLMDEFIDIYR